MCRQFDSGLRHFSFYKGFLLYQEDGLLAQVVEHLTFNQVVAGSSPAWLSTKDEAKEFSFSSFFYSSRMSRDERDQY